MREHLYYYRVVNVVSVFDADTLTAEISVGFHMTARIPCRLAKINAPELTEPERESGLTARDYLRERLRGALIEERGVILWSHKRDKYGRWLITLFVDGVNINDELMERGYAVAYDGN
jgi:micrococcal nuclease